MAASTLYIASPTSAQGSQNAARPPTAAAKQSSVLESAFGVFSTGAVVLATETAVNKSFWYPTEIDRHDQMLFVQRTNVTGSH